MRMMVGGALRPFLAAREVVDELGLRTDRFGELLSAHRAALALLEPDLPMTSGMRARRERMRMLNHLPNVRLELRPVRDAYAALLHDLAEAPITIAVREGGWDPESEALLSRCAQVTIEGPAPMATRLDDDAARAAREAFECHAFGVSDPHAEAWARTGDPSAHYVAGLSAHHRDPFDPGRSARAAAHFAVVAAESASPHERAHARYRRAVHLVRHAGEAEAALREADAALEEASGVGAMRACYRAWSLNARAFALHRLGRAADAAADLEEALAALGELVLDPPLDRYVEESITTMEMNLARARS